MKTKLKLLCSMCILFISFIGLSINANATEYTGTLPTESGTGTVTWMYNDSNKILSISGTGTLKGGNYNYDGPGIINYALSNAYPNTTFKIDKIETSGTIKVKNSVGDYMFSMPNSDVK